MTSIRSSKPFEAALELVKKWRRARAVPGEAEGRYLIGPEIERRFKMVTELQKANVPVYRARKALNSARIRAGHVGDPAAAAAQTIVEKVAQDSALPVRGVDRPPAVDGFRLKPGTQVGLYAAPATCPAAG